jgi:hypothetical protein
MIGIVNTEDTTPIPLDDESFAAICDQIYQLLPKVKKKTWTRNEIKKRCHLGAPEMYRARYIDTLFRHQAAISMDKYDLGLSKDFTHRIHLKDNEPIYRKQFNLPEAPGRMAETWSSQKNEVHLQLTDIVCIEETRPRTTNCAGLLAAESTLTH